MQQHQRLYCANDLPAYCASLAHHLTQQPVTRNEAGCVIRKLSYAVNLIKEKIYDEDMYNNLTIMAETILPIEQAAYLWKIKSYEDELPVWHADHGIYVEEPTRPEMLCSLEELREIYQRILDSVQHGWQPAMPEEYEKPYFKQSRSEWFLFIKQKQCEAEFLFIDALIRRLALPTTQVHINDQESECERHCGRKSNFMYLWVKKSNATHTISICNFTIDERPDS